MAGFRLKITKEDKDYVSSFSKYNGHDLSIASSTYQTSLPESLPEELEITLGSTKVVYKKKHWTLDDKTYGLRYGTNPSQIGAFYVPEIAKGPLDWKFLKMGKNGPSTTNIEDISQAIEVLKFFDSDRPSSIVMKHLIPSGFMVGTEEMNLADIYTESRNLDYLSSFGGVVVFNTTVDIETAKKLSESFIEVIAAPKVDQEVVDYFNSLPQKAQVRIVELGSLDTIPKYKGDQVTPTNFNLKVQVDGTIIIEQPFLSQLTSIDKLYFNSFIFENDKKYQVQYKPTEEALQDLLDSYHVLQAVRSNAAVIMKDGRAVCGSGETKRVDAVKRASDKVQDYITKKNLPKDSTILENWDGAVASTDGFPPFDDTVEELVKVGVKHALFPPGGKNTYQVIEKANELGMSITFTPYNARCFTHK